MVLTFRHKLYNNVHLNFVAVYIVGWSDLALFSDFRKGHISADRVYFYESNSKKLANSATHAWQSFICWNFPNTLLVHQRTNVKKKIVNKKILNFLFKKKLPNGFWSKHQKTFLFFVSLSFWLLQNSKNTFPPAWQVSKRFLKFCCCCCF